MRCHGMAGRWYLSLLVCVLQQTWTRHSRSYLHFYIVAHVCFSATSTYKMSYNDQVDPQAVINEAKAKIQQELLMNVTNVSVNLSWNNLLHMIFEEWSFLLHPFAVLNGLLQTIQASCFEKCIYKPGSSLSSREKTCLEACVDRYFECVKHVGVGLTSQSS